jgi:hypothetical protein
MPFFLDQSRLGKTGGVKKAVYGINNTHEFRHIPSTHAEMEAMVRLFRFMKRRGIDKNTSFDLTVIRFSKNGTLGESRPCHHCITFLESSKLNINRVYYSTEDGIIVNEKFSDMVATKFDKAYISSGMKLKIFRKK